MGDDNSETDESEIETFQVEYNASELYALHGLLRYLSIEMDQQQSLVAESLAKKTHNTMSTDRFDTAMEEEMDQFEEQMKEQQQMMGSPTDVGMGNVMGGFQ